MEESTAIQPYPETPRSKRWIYWLALLFLIGIVAVFLWWRFQRPSQGTIVVPPVVEMVDLADPSHRKRYQGKYFTFTYPYDFQRREDVEAVKFPLLERVYLSRSDIEGRKIALILQDNLGNSLEEYSSFRIRRDDPGTYTEEKIEKNGLNATLFTKDTIVFEVTAFLHRNNSVVSLSASSPTTLDGLRDEVVALLESFEWQVN